MAVSISNLKYFFFSRGDFFLGGGGGTLPQNSHYPFKDLCTTRESMGIICCRMECNTQTYVNENHIGSAVSEIIWYTQTNTHKQRIPVTLLLGFYNFSPKILDHLGILPYIQHWCVIFLIRSTCTSCTSPLWPKL